MPHKYQQWYLNPPPLPSKLYIDSQMSKACRPCFRGFKNDQDPGSALRNLWTSWERAKAVIQVLQSKARSGLNRRAKHPEDSRTWKITSGWGINIQKASAALQKPRNAGGIQNMEAVEVRASVIAHSRALASNQGWLTIMTKDYLVSTMDWKPTIRGGLHRHGKFLDSRTQQNWITAVNRAP